MWFKNTFIFRLVSETPISADTLSEKLAIKPLMPCSGLDKQSRGWVSCHGDKLVHGANKQILFALGVEQKLLPTTIVNRFAKERAAEIEAQQGYKVGRKEMKELKESITEELLPRAFSLQRKTYAWLDTINGYLVIDAASSTKTEELLEFMNKSLDNLPFKQLHTAISPTSAMTDWLAGNNAPAGFTIDRELELRATGESKATIRYANHELEGEEILKHIASGKRVTRLGMTWNDRISFVLTEQMQIKRIEFLDIIKNQSTEMAENEDELFEVDFTLMTGELAKMFADLTYALGGEVKSV